MPTSRPTNSTILVGLSYLPIITKVKVVMDTPQVESVSMLPTQVVLRTLTRTQPTSSIRLLLILVEFCRVSMSTSSRTETHYPNEKTMCDLKRMYAKAGYGCIDPSGMVAPFSYSTSEISRPRKASLTRCPAMKNSFSKLRVPMKFFNLTSSERGNVVPKGPSFL